MTIHIDTEFKCHISDDGTMREFDVAFFDNKCAELIEGYRYIPVGETMTGEDGTEYQGEQMFPWKDSEKLRTAQLEYELADAKEGYTELGVDING